MDRRIFLQLSTGTLAMATFEGSQLHAFGSPSTLHSKEMTASEFHSGRRFVTTDQGRIAYIDKGTGSGALFLHGFPLNSFQWRGVIPQLSKLRRCIAPDFLGLGYTEVAAGQSVAPEAQVAMLVQLLDKLSIPEVDIVANDSGGAIAQLFVTPAPWLADKKLARSKKGLGGQCYANPAHLTNEAIETYLAPLLSSPQRKLLTNAYAIGLDPNPLAGIESALKTCSVATRIVWGAADTIFSQASPDYLSRIVANSLGVRRVAGAKLFFPEEMPELIVEEASFVWSL